MTDSPADVASYAGDALLGYLREAALAGRIHPATARSRRRAAEALFPYCKPEELSDLRQLDLQDLRARVADLARGGLRPEVADLYLERLRSALRDYLADYASLAEGPADSRDDRRRDGSEASAATAPGTGLAAGPATKDADSTKEASVTALEAARLRLDQHRADIIPVPLAADRVVFLQGIPADLTRTEARKIARVVEALATPGDDIS